MCCSPSHLETSTVGVGSQATTTPRNPKTLPDLRAVAGIAIPEPPRPPVPEGPVSLAPMDDSTAEGVFALPSETQEFAFDPSAEDSSYEDESFDEVEPEASVGVGDSAVDDEAHAPGDADEGDSREGREHEEASEEAIADAGSVDDVADTPDSAAGAAADEGAATGDRAPGDAGGGDRVDRAPAIDAVAADLVPTADEPGPGGHSTGSLVLVGLLALALGIAIGAAAL